MSDQALFERFGRTIPTGTVLFREGDPGEHMYVIQSGRVQLTRRVRGRDTHLAALPPGEFFGEMAIVNNQPRTATATVIEDAQLLLIDARTFEAMIRGNSEIAVRFIKKLAARLAQANQQVEMLLLADLNHRVTHFLRQLAQQRGVQEGVGTRIDVSVEDIAEAVAATPQHVAACLKRLEQARLIATELGGIVVAEPGKLDEFLQFLELKEHFGAD
jgi:CRP/FNR family transcriptional regulator, cyclic AMP receptor protein